ncbi:glycoside hydrolase family 30 protein [Marinagarivorans cellulosilyticus]|uniref:Glucosylceramidase n=1 Tax=Marinagarivorans cellulosilyticus TaxID=2721545 RepID=A0AAN1WL17_9GAMM|nr:glycoside hydrolase family 30 beta sandwich domain-containing protein [Marinagarivorans cellulosilyticus]BCD99566.1 glucosylceramidase [Marinagarivorans cellulosilyticus]
MNYRTILITALSCALVACQQTPTKPHAPNNLVTQAPALGAPVAVYTTAKNTEQRLSQGTTLTFAKSVQPSEGEISVFVNPHKSFQTFIGVGGAFTDASAEVFAKLPQDKQQELLTAYYDKEQGIGYSLARTTIHSSDFGSHSFTYIEEGDKELKTFSIDHDREFRLPLIKQAIDAAGGELLVYASPWSPPAFMKSNNNMLKGGKLLPEYFESWAMYYTKFIKAYEAEGIPIWGITIQNEPMAVQRWESNIYTAEEERDFLKNYLGPIMEREGLGDKNIVVWDHNRDLISQRANTIFEDPEAAKYAWGIGFHWYETWAGGTTMHDNLYNVAQSFPDKKLLFTEGTNERFSRDKYQHWPNAERYGHSMINDFNAGTVGWTDWNILLDENGGPNHVQNFCFSPIHADTRTGELIYTPSYYYIGHFSKFIAPGAKRISTTVSRSHLLATSFQNDDGKTATVVMNQSDDDIAYNFIVEDKEVELTIPARAMQTLVY